jgi:shikimate kinase
MRHLVLVGLMGTGKSTIGAMVGERLGLPYVDGDEQLEARNDGATAAQIAERDGIDHLHQLEADLLLDLLSRHEPSVIGPAASVIDDPRVLPALGYAARTVWLDAPVEQLAGRVAEKPHRPIEDDVVGMLTRQREERGPRFAAAADFVVDLGTLSRDEATDAIAAFFGV